MAYEVKAVRAVWDPSLSIPGTNRRGGWRCPTGTRYGGQITDRFGRSCGWGVARRIANQISDIGQRLENVDDARRGRRIARRERRILARLNPQGGGAGRLERGLRGVADRLEAADTPSPRGVRRRTVVARPPSVDTPEVPRELTPAPRPQRRRRAPNLRDSEQRRMDREIEQPGAPRTGEAPVRPARRRQPARPRGEGNLRESEQRRMDREIEQPGAPRTGEAPARRRRRAVVEATKKPKAPTRQADENDPLVVAQRDLNEAQDMLRMLQQNSAAPQRIRRQREDIIKLEEEVRRLQPPRSVVEPKIVKPRRPRANPDRNNIGDLLDAESEERRAVAGPKRRKPKPEASPARPQPGNSDNAANSERMRQARADRARGAGQRVNLNQVLNDRDFEGYVLNDVIPNDRIMIINDPANFPISATAQKNKRNEAQQRIVAANARLERIEQAITRGELADNDFIERRQDEEVSIARIKTAIKDYRDAWQEVYDTNLSGEPPAGASARGGKQRTEDLLEEFRNPPARIRKSILELPDVPNIEYLGSPIEISGENLEVPDPQKLNSALRKAQQAIDAINDPLANPGELPRYSAVRIGNKLYVVLDSDRIAREQNWDRGESRVGGLFGVERVVRGRIQLGQDPVDEPSNAPTRRDIRDVPDELKHVAPKMEAAKFKKEDEDLIEEVLLQMQDPKLLGELGLLADQALFNQNEGRQLAVRNFQKELSRVADLIRANPDADVSALITEAKRKYIGYVRPQGGVAGVRTKLAELETQLGAEFRLMRSPLGNSPEAKEIFRVATMKKIAQLQSDIGKYEGHLQLIEALGPEIRKASERRKQGFVFNPDATNIPKPLPEDVAKKINDQINEAIERRQGKLAKYLKQRHPNGGAPYEDMTPVKWGRLTAPEKAEYLKQAYSHQRIEGKNGKLYRATATVSPQNGFQISVTFDEINANGEVVRAAIAKSSRSVSVSQGIVSQNTMFVTSKVDRGADIQTIYNQHAFLYLKQIGVTKANVNAADDGQYVWARVGFKRGSGLGNGDLQVLQAPLKFYEDFGPGGLINNEAEYARIKSILAQARGGKKYQHQDIIFALDDPTGDRARMEYVKQWFKANLGFGGGTLSFAEQKIGQKLPKKPKIARPRIQVEPPRLA